MRRWRTRCIFNQTSYDTLSYVHGQRGFSQAFSEPLFVKSGQSAVRTVVGAERLQLTYTKKNNKFFFINNLYECNAQKRIIARAKCYRNDMNKIVLAESKI